MQKKSSLKNKKTVEKKEISLEEFEKKVKELAKQGLTSEKIGETLRKQGIHPKEFGKKISKIMGSMYFSPDIINLEKKLERIKKHAEKNKQDKRAIREKDRIYAQLRKIKEYHKVA